MCQDSNIYFKGTNSVSSVTSSFGDLNLAGGQQVSYQQTTTHSQTTSHNQSESRQGSYSSLGPANPIPSNYGAGSPPPFTPPAAVSYPEKSGNNFMPGSGMPGSGFPSAGGLVADQRATVNTENMSKDEFEEAKARGAIPTWMVSENNFKLVIFVLIVGVTRVIYFYNRNTVAVSWLVLPL